MKKKYLIFLLLLSFPLYTRADKTLDSLLNVLDLTIQNSCVPFFSAGKVVVNAPLRRSKRARSLPSA